MRTTFSIDEVKVGLVEVEQRGNTPKWKVTLTFPSDVHVRRVTGRLTEVVVTIAPDSMSAAQLKREEQRGD